MGTGYVRNDVGNNIADGNVINASDLDGEFDAVQAAFNGSTGHSHDGTTGEGPQIDTAGIANDAVDATKLDETDSYTVAGLSVTGNTTLGDAATDTVTFTADVASNILPNADGTLSLGASGSSWGDAYVTSLYLGGTAVTSTAAELNILDGVTSTTAELNILDGVTSTSSELNLVDGSTAGTVVNSKAVIYGASGEVNATTLQVGGVAITATPAEINTLDGITASTAELNILDGVTSTSSELNLVDGSVAGTVTNSKAVIYGASGEVNATTLQVGGVAITSTPAELNILDGVTATAAELNYNDITTLGTSEASKVVTADANGDITIAGASYNVVWDKSVDTLEFGDNAKAAFGTGSDLQVYHNGTDSFISEGGVGTLKISSEGNGIEFLKGASETMATMAPDGAVTLYHDNASKLATTATGIDVTGTAVTDGLTVEGTSKVQQTKEKITVSATAATGTINYDALTQSVLYYTSDASANWTVNVRGDGSNTLNSIMSTGEALTVAFLVTQGSTAYYNSAFQVDGSSVTPNWQGGSAPTEGTASGIDVYTYNIIKTADATFTVLASVVDFS